MLNDEVIKNNVDVIILITWLMLKSLIKSKNVLYQFSSDLNEANSFYNSFSEVGQKIPCIWKVWKTLPGIGVISKPELFFFYLNFFGCMQGQGFAYETEMKSLAHEISFFGKSVLNMFN